MHVLAHIFVIGEARACAAEPPPPRKQPQLPFSITGASWTRRPGRCGSPSMAVASRACPMPKEGLTFSATGLCCGFPASSVGNCFEASASAVAPTSLFASASDSPSGSGVTIAIVGGGVATTVAAAAGAAGRLGLTGRPWRAPPSASASASPSAADAAAAAAFEATAAAAAKDDDAGGADGAGSEGTSAAQGAFPAAFRLRRGAV
mmetsp:Transcript_96519/g.277193  ORF Transcript_96519/g.277193 Transcript_96519/m.277193 type:complete len:205 (-) Transcript_96519:497-1111(-)